MLNTSLKLPFSEKQIIEATEKCTNTPFFLYSEDLIIKRSLMLQEAFKNAWIDFINHFAVKANPNIHIVDIISKTWMWTDCSSDFEIDLSRRLWLSWDKVMFTSNNTTESEFRNAMKIWAIINIDDISHLNSLNRVWVPEIVSCRFNPWELKKWNKIIWSPKDIKYWSNEEDIIRIYKKLLERWISRFGLHTMVVSDERNIEEHLWTAKMLFELALKIRQETWITMEFINLWWWIWVPYTPEQEDVDIFEFAKWVKALKDEILESNNYRLKTIRMENWRFITWPSWAYISKVINVAEKYKTFVWLDWWMQDFPRPWRLKTYHHVSVIWKQDETIKKVQSLTWSLCIWSDVFASDRELPVLVKWDIIAIHTAWAHGHATWYNYNWRTRCAEVLLKSNWKVFEIIRQKQELDDLYWWIDMTKFKK